MKFDMVAFLDWLKESKVSPATVLKYKQHIEKIKKLYPRAFDINTDDDFMSLYGLFLEYFHKWYFLTSIEIGTAIDYFKEIIPFINSDGWGISAVVDISLYYKKKKYFIQSISINDLPAWLSLYAFTCIDENTQYSSSDSEKPSFHHLPFYVGIKNFKEQTGIHDFLDVGVQIEYRIDEITQRKAAIGSYFKFLRNANNIPQKVLFANEKLTLIRKYCPKNWTPKYSITIPLSGEHPMQIMRLKSVIGPAKHVLLLGDLADIFHLSINTVWSVISTYKIDHYDYDAKNKKGELIKRTFYSIDDVNRSLSSGFQHTPIKATNNKIIPYDKEGYEYWCRREDALKLLGVKKTNFYRLLPKIKTFINYTKSVTGREISCKPDKNNLYYKPELKIVGRELHDIKKKGHKHFIKQYANK